jgi:hypothetical protein
MSAAASNREPNGTRWRAHAWGGALVAIALMGCAAPEEISADSSAAEGTGDSFPARTAILEEWDAEDTECRKENLAQFHACQKTHEDQMGEPSAKCNNPPAKQRQELQCVERVETAMLGQLGVPAAAVTKLRAALAAFRDNMLLYGLHEEAELQRAPAKETTAFRYDPAWFPAVPDLTKPEAVKHYVVLNYAWLNHVAPKTKAGVAEVQQAAAKFCFALTKDVVRRFPLAEGVCQLRAVRRLQLFASPPEADTRVVRVSK